MKQGKARCPKKQGNKQICIKDTTWTLSFETRLNLGLISKTTRASGKFRITTGTSPELGSRTTGGCTLAPIAPRVPLGSRNCNSIRIRDAVKNVLADFAR